jgi:hypothetical protein
MIKKLSRINNIDKPEYKFEEYAERNFYSDVTILTDYKEVQ